MKNMNLILEKKNTQMCQKNIGIILLILCIIFLDKIILIVLPTESQKKFFL